MYYFAFQKCMKKIYILVIIVASGKMIVWEDTKMREKTFILLCTILFSCEISYTNKFIIHT